MPSEGDKSRKEASVSYIETDIDCHICLRNVHQALTALPGVDTVTEDVNAGCLVVTHTTDPGRLIEVVTQVGHRFDKADNGEIGMGSITAVEVGSCEHRSNAPDRGEVVR